MIKDIVVRGRTISGLVLTGIAIDSYRRTLQNDAVIRDFYLAKESFDERLAKVDQIKEGLVYTKDKYTFINTKLNAGTDRISEWIMAIKKSEEDIKLLAEKNIDGNNNTLIETKTRESWEIISKKIIPELTDLKDSLSTSQVDLVESKIETVVKTIFDSTDSNHFTDEFLAKFQSLLDTLSSQQLGALVHILFSLIICSCVVNTAIAYYGDMLIIYFKLESKYPRLAKWIKYRRTFQHYSIALNLIIIWGIAAYIVYLNISVFDLL